MNYADIGTRVYLSCLPQQENTVEVRILLPSLLKMKRKFDDISIQGAVAEYKTMEFSSPRKRDFAHLEWSI